MLPCSPNSHYSLAYLFRSSSTFNCLRVTTFFFLLVYIDLRQPLPQCSYTAQTPNSLPSIFNSYTPVSSTVTWSPPSKIKIKQLLWLFDKKTKESTGGEHWWVLPGPDLGSTFLQLSSLLFIQVCFDLFFSHTYK